MPLFWGLLSIVILLQACFLLQWLALVLAGTSRWLRIASIGLGCTAIISTALYAQRSLCTVDICTFLLPLVFITIGIIAIQYLSLYGSFLLPAGSTLRGVSIVVCGLSSFILCLGIFLLYGGVLQHIFSLLLHRGIAASWY